MDNYKFCIGDRIYVDNCAKVLIGIDWIGYCVCILGPACAGNSANDYLYCLKRIHRGSRRRSAPPGHPHRPEPRSRTAPFPTVPAPISAYGPSFRIGAICRIMPSGRNAARLTASYSFPVSIGVCCYLFYAAHSRSALRCLSLSEADMRPRAHGKPWRKTC